MKRVLLSFAFIFLLISAFTGCNNSPKAELKNGIWRAILKTKSGVEIPFNFELIDSAGKTMADIINGKERFKVDEISIKNDSVIFQMPLFDSEIKAVIKNGALSGKWVKHLANKDAVMEFTAEPGVSWRFFKTNVTAKYNLTGRWSSTFISKDGKDTTHAIGEFVQNGKKLKGTFLTSTGDYRFLEGTVSDDKLYLSCFEGGHAFLFTGKLENDKTISNGKFYSGYSSVESWTAKKDNKAILPDAYSLTALKPGFKKIDFNFPNLVGEKISLSDDKFKNKVVVVQLLGSWCPNCMDETAYLSPFYKKYKDRGVEVIGLAYERTTDFEKSRQNIQRLRNRFDVGYDMLVTGYTNDKQEVAKSLPMLNKFLAFPTTIIIDKKGDVRKIHTGFSGPGTGNHYIEFVNEFEKTIDNLLAEK
ncbi:MAG: TlpA disulfide reductase family protein [Daejeonella sp.]